MFSAQATIAPTYQPVTDQRTAAKARFFMPRSVRRTIRGANGTLVPNGCADRAGQQLAIAPKHRLTGRL
jgi:hypothetical protein